MNHRNSKWALVPIGVCMFVIAAVAAYAKLDGAQDAQFQALRTDVNAMTAVLPEIRDRLKAIETNQKWMMKGMNDAID